MLYLLFLKKCIAMPLLNIQVWTVSIFTNKSLTTNKKTECFLLLSVISVRNVPWQRESTRIFSLCCVLRWTITSLWDFILCYSQLPKLKKCLKGSGLLVLILSYILSRPLFLAINYIFYNWRENKFWQWHSLPF